MSYATVFIEELETGIASDEKGEFILKDLCQGGYHLRFNHIGCETNTRFIQLLADTSILITMHHHNELVDEVVVHDNSSEHGQVVSATILSTEISEMSNRDLTGLLDEVSGVSSLKSGAGISKPVVHGMYGNRLVILNNGIPQAGQQWGSDHAPEIDPFAAGHISVVKGAGALAHPGSALGGAILIEPKPMPTDPHIHGLVGYIFQTNGLGNTINVRLEQNAKWASWRVNGTTKIIGDRSAPSYLLTNTGKREYDISTQFEKRFSSKWIGNLYYSLFNTRIGILRGAHIGNLTDLENAIGREEPLFTRDVFSHHIQAPMQDVRHHLAKLEISGIINQHNNIKLKYAFQYNDRKEFDVRRSGRSDTPSLNLGQSDHFVEGQHLYLSENELTLRSGIQLRIIDNTNNPKTGVLPLIPDYRSYEVGAYVIAQKEWKRISLEGAARYDLKHLEAVTISTTLPRDIIRYKQLFNNYAFSIGSNINMAKFLKVNVNVGHILRAPAVNELYSQGLHQGVSGIEEGDRTLNTERSTKAVLSADWRIGDKLFIQTLGYFQYINDYIYLQPEEDFRLTIRGAFPVFTYQQTDATILGADAMVSYEPIHFLKLKATYSYILGNDIRNEVPLVYMPSNNTQGSITYSLSDGTRLKNTQFTVNGKYVFRQQHLNNDQDLLATPDGYYLLGASIRTNLQVNKLEWQFSVSGENLLNSKYRDYLNRQRYFADELGWNLNARIGVKF
jgi:iron complex outermembrane receptor protein